MKRYCPWCGGPLTERFLEGRTRQYCEREDRCIYENPLPAATCLVFDPDGRILLVRRNREPGAGRWSLPGGFVESGESALDAALRELKEETGLTGSRVSIVDVLHHESEFYRSTILIIGYRVGMFEGELEAGDDASDARFFTVDEMPEPAFASHRRLIDKALGGGTGPKAS